MFDPTPENWLRALFLYGKNQSSYKIGLTDRLLYWADKNISEVRLDDFGDNWLNTYIERTKDGEQQSRLEKNRVSNADNSPLTLS